MEKTVQQNKNLKWIRQESKENYLKAIYMLGTEKTDGVRYVDIEEHFGFSKASVCKAVRALRDEGCVTIDRGYYIRLTEQGQTIAERTYEKFSFFRDLLLRAGVEPGRAEEEACKLEHGISSGSLSSLISIYTNDTNKKSISGQIPAVTSQKQDTSFS